ncbi:tetratricopeptide repeat protein [Streptomyces chartreusis]|uniref:tetratricopeptide repeat protein n=1 Tax=Streptomyces chartreusis TaxID=1969 RepID=UPI0033E4C548
MGGKKAKGRNKKSGSQGHRGAARPGSDDGRGNSFASSRFHRAAALGSGTQYNTFVHEYAPTPSALASLPELPAEFAGREEDVAFLLDILDPGSGVERPAIVVAGMGGVGKTTLAHAAGHKSLQRKWFTGVLLVNLHGYDPQPAQAEQALDSLLRLLGVPSKHIPPTGPEREVFYRSHLAERGKEGERLLVVADNASSAAQVKPLLPPAPHGVIVTSRKALPGVGRPRSLHQLQPEDAVVLLDLALREAHPNDQRVKEDGEAAECIAIACGCLPLALQIVAAQLIQDPGQPLAERADRLSSSEGRLDSINDGERDLRTVFDQTLDSLIPQQQDLFRMLALNAGPDISTAAAAALTHQSETVTDSQLGQLAATHLIERSPLRGRWQMHDLLRDYAQDRAQAHCQENRTARRKYEHAHQRLADYYVRSAENADTHISTSSHFKPSPVFPGRDEALVWLDAEWLNLIATAHAQAPSEITARISFSLRDYLEWRHRSQDVLAISALALDTCRTLGDKKNEPGAWNNVGSALERLYRHDEALTAYRNALELATEANETHNQAAAWNGIGNTLHSLHRYEEALGGYQKALEIAEQTHEAHGRTITLNNIGSTLETLHRYDEALNSYHSAFDLAEQTHDTDSQSAAWNHIGNALEGLNRYDEALIEYQKALELAIKTNNTHNQAVALNNVGSVLRRLHRYDEARAAFSRALELAKQTNDTRGKAVALNNIGTVLGVLNRYGEALTEHQKALVLAERANDIRGQAVTLNDIGNAYEALHRYDEALTEYQKALALAGRAHDIQGQTVALTNIGNAFEKLHRYDEALTEHKKALVLAVGMNDTGGQAVVLSNIGNAYEALHRYDEALTEYQKALALAELTNDVQHQAVALRNIGNAFEKLHRYDEALTAHKKALALVERANDIQSQAVALNDIGNAYEALHRYDEALTEYQKALVLAERANNTDAQASSWNNVGSAQEKTHRYAEALAAYRVACGLFEKVGDVKGQAIAWNNTGTALRGLRQYNEAVVVGRRAVEKLEMLKDFTHAGEALSELAASLDAAGADPDVVGEAWMRSASAYQRAGAKEKELQSRVKLKAKGS